MKNGLFGKILLLALAVIMLFALSSCGEKEAVEYDITGKSDFSVADTTFDGDVVIKGEGGSVTFVNCIFNGNIINKGGEGARVILVEDCKFAEDSECIIESSLKEATLETDLPKFLIFCEAPSISCKNCGAVGEEPSVKVAAQLPENFVCPACGAGTGDGNRHHSVCAKVRKIFCAVKSQHARVDARLIGAVHAFKGVGNGPFYGIYRMQNAFSLKSMGMIPALVHFMRSCRRARGRTEYAKSAAVKLHGGLHRGPAPGIQNFAGVYVQNFHKNPSFLNFSMTKRPQSYAPDA